MALAIFVWVNNTKAVLLPSEKGISQIFDLATISYGLWYNKCTVVQYRMLTTSYYPGLEPTHDSNRIMNEVKSMTSSSSTSIHLAIRHWVGDLRLHCTLALCERYCSDSYHLVPLLNTMLTLLFCSDVREGGPL